MTTFASEEEQARMVEALLFASAEPLSVRDLTALLPAGCDVSAALRRLQSRYAGGGVVLEKTEDKWAFRTAADLRHLMQPFRQERRKLSRAGLEVLAIIAYHQPITRTEIENIRGVSVSAGTLDALIERGWVGFGRRRQSPGRPVTFITTPDFLDHFGLASVEDLPGLEDLRSSGFLADAPDAEFLASHTPEEETDPPQSPAKDDLI